MTERATLLAEPQDVSAFRLKDGRLTEDHKTAQVDLEASRQARAEEATTVAAALLRLPIELGGGRPTPARVDFAHSMAAAGLLPEAVVSHVIASGHVSSGAWDQLRTLLGLLDVETCTVACWQVTLRDSTAALLDLPTAWDPLEYTDEEQLPIEALGRVLDALGHDGWRCVEITERRGSGDDEGWECDADLFGEDGIPIASVACELVRWPDPD